MLKDYLNKMFGKNLEKQFNELLYLLSEKPQNPILKYYSEYEEYMEKAYFEGDINEEQYKKMRRLSYGTEHSAGLDLPIWDERLVNGEWSTDGTYVLQPMEQKTFKTGVYLEIPPGHYGQLDSRSSTSKKKLDLLCHTLDADFRGNIRVAVINLNTEPVEIKNGDYLFQVIIKPYTKVVPQRVESPYHLGDTERGEGGFGSTDEKFK